MRSYPKHIYESTSEERKEDIEQESRVRFKTEDTSGNTKEGGCEIVESCESLCIVYHRLLHNRTYLHFSFGNHDDEIAFVYCGGKVTKTIGRYAMLQ